MQLRLLPTLCLGTLFIACGQAEQAPVPAAPIETAPQAKSSTTTADASLVADVLSLSDDALHERLQNASETELTALFRQMRSADLPADYRAPEWLSSAPNAMDARKALRQHYQSLTERMASEGRLNTLRTHGPEMRRMMQDEKYVDSLGAR